MEVLPAVTAELVSSMESQQDDDDDETSEAESNESGGVFGMTDMAAELATCEEQMT